jgi:hypothetical protein
MTAEQHVPQCPLRAFGGIHTDAARRMCDLWTLHRLGTGLYDAVGKWYAVRLDDGTSDGVLYDSKRECIQHQRGWEYLYAYVGMSIAQMNVCDAEIYLAVQRRMYEKGIRMVDPDARNGGHEPIKRVSREDMIPLSFTLAGTNLIIPGRE